jgi:predicted transposase/invertase (TIGR01784 family)
MREGKIYYDIRFYVYLPNTADRVKLIIDVEAQNKVRDLGYDIITRGVYYCARMLSEQKGTEFERSNYDDIKKVYSIWIGVNCPKEKQNTIAEFSISQKNIVGNYPETGSYDLLSVIFVGLSDEIADERDEYRLHRLLETFFSETLDEKRKRKIIETEYGIHYSSDVERSVREMCNVSQGLIEKGEKRGRIKGKLEGKIEAYMDVGMSIEDIAERLGISVEEVQNIALSMEFSQ